MIFYIFYISQPFLLVIDFNDMFLFINQSFPISEARNIFFYYYNVHLKKYEMIKEEKLTLEFHKYINILLYIDTTLKARTLN